MLLRLLLFVFFFFVVFLVFSLVTLVMDGLRKRSSPNVGPSVVTADCSMSSAVPAGFATLHGRPVRFQGFRLD